MLYTGVLFVYTQSSR